MTDKNKGRPFLAIALLLAVVFTMITIISSPLVAAVAVLSLIVLALGVLFYITWKIQHFFKSAEVVKGADGRPEFPASNLRPVPYRPNRPVAHNLAVELAVLGFQPLGSFQAAESEVYCDVMRLSAAGVYAVIIDGGEGADEIRVDLSRHYPDGGVFRVGDREDGSEGDRPPELVRWVYKGYNPAHLLEIMLRESPEGEVLAASAATFTQLMEQESRRLDQWLDRAEGA